MFSVFLLASVATFYATAVIDKRMGNPLPRDCSDILKYIPQAEDGIYGAYPESDRDWSLQVQCDMRGDIGWTVILDRINGSTDFSRNWEGMKQGFGNVRGEHFLGLEYLHYVTRSDWHRLLIEITEDRGTWTEMYQYFQLFDENHNYTLRLQTFNFFQSTNPKNAMESLNDCSFSTVDKDNSGHTMHVPFILKGPNWYSDRRMPMAFPFSDYTHASSCCPIMWWVNDRFIFPTKLRMMISRKEW